MFICLYDIFVFHFFCEAETFAYMLQTSVPRRIIFYEKPA